MVTGHQRRIIDIDYFPTLELNDSELKHVMSKTKSLDIIIDGGLQWKD